MNQEIIDYLQSAEPAFDAGFALFCKYSRNEPLMSWISRRRDREKLMYELEKLSQLEPVVNPVQATHLARWSRPEQTASSAPSSKVQAPAVPVTFKTYDERRTRRADLPPELQKVYDGISEDYKLRRGLHEKMKMATTNEDRASFRARVLETDGRIRGGFREIDTYLARKAQEQEKAKADSDFKESTARSYISKALKKETLSAAQKATIRERYNALISHGCTVTEELTAKLKNLGLI